MKKLTESQIQQALFQHVFFKRQQNPIWEFVISNPNEGGAGNAGRERTKKMIREGQSKGFPDISVLVPRCVEKDGKTYHWGALFLELKRLGGKVSHAQQVWIDRLNDNGYRAKVIETNDYMDVVKDIESWLGLSKPESIGVN